MSSLQLQSTLDRGERTRAAERRRDDIARGGLAGWQVRKLETLARGDLRGLTARRLAQEVRLSLFHFTRAFSSTMGVYKTHSAPGEGRALREDLPLRPGDIYGWTKLAGEELCQLYGRTHGIPSVALRFGMFVPEPFFRYGIRLLYGGVDTRDVVRSVLTSMDALISGELTWGAFNVESAVPFVDHDADQLTRDPLPVLDTHYPGASQLLRERGVGALAPITVTYPMHHAKQVLGFEPEYNFEQWLDELQRRPDERADSNPPWP